MLPHYAKSGAETAVIKVQEVLAEIAPEISLQVVSPYYNDEDLY